MSPLELHMADSITQHTAEVKLVGLFEPVPVSFTFEAIGWSVLAGLLALGIVVWVILAIKIYVKNRYRREALARIQELHEDPNGILIVLKKVAIHRFGRVKVAKLSGAQWFQFLEETAQNVQFLKYFDSIQKLMYEQIEPDHSVLLELNENAIKWVKTHA